MRHRLLAATLTLLLPGCNPGEVILRAVGAGTMQAFVDRCPGQPSYGCDGGVTLVHVSD